MTLGTWGQGLAWDLKEVRVGWEVTLDWEAGLLVACGLPYPEASGASQPCSLVHFKAALQVGLAVS